MLEDGGCDHEQVRWVDVWDPWALVRGERRLVGWLERCAECNAALGYSTRREEEKHAFFWQ